MQALFSPLAIAPMIDWTNTHFRVLMRLIAPRALLYTEMLTPQAILHRKEFVLAYHPMEHPLALQLGGSQGKILAQAALIAEESGYCEVNLNLGCPSNKVQAGQFGACLMTKPDLVAECIFALKQAVRIPVTAKIRLGIDEQDSYEFFADFVKRLVDCGCDKLIIHARKAWLKGLNPKQNRTIPPVQYDFVYQIKKTHPKLPMVINGNIQSLSAIQEHLQQVDGVMLGRLACANPYELARIHQDLYPEHPLLSRQEVFAQYQEYMALQFQRGVPLSILLKPLFNLQCGMPNSKQWKQRLLVAQQNKDIALL